MAHFQGISHKDYTFETNYFNQPWTWIKRSLEAFVAIGLLYWIDLMELEQGSDLLWIGYILSGFIAAYILLRPKDELALDEENLYYIQRSLIPYFNRRRACKISQIREIRSAGTFLQHFPMNGFLPAEMIFSRYEISFKDGRFEKRSLTIPKKDLNKIVSKVKEKIR